MSKKATDIVSYITIIGWIIAYFVGTKEESKFHLNQALVLVVAQLALSILGRIFTGVFGIVIAVLDLIILILWIIGLVAACKGEEKEVPVLGGIRLLK